jgi:hypothetical protein
LSNINPTHPHENHRLVPRRIAARSRRLALLAAPQPAILTARYKGEMHPVIKVIKSDPVVLVDGREKRIKFSPVYQPQAGTEFSPASVEITAAALEGNRPIGYEEYTNATLARAGVKDFPQYTRSEINLRLKAGQTLTGGFVVVLLATPEFDRKNMRFDPRFYDRDRLQILTSSVEPNRQILVRELPTLPAGTETAIQITDRYLDLIDGTDFVVMLFDAQGRQIETNVSG